MSILKFFQLKAKTRLLHGEPCPWIENSPRSAYIRQCVLSYPFWVERSALVALWTECRRQEQLTGEHWVLDHIVPLTHPLVSGLSVPWNLRPMPYRCNAAKGNRWAPDQTELFPNA